eukprot:TRINITY_DN4791_c0_g1_i1.p1 TRINITY_DN4791_c0_g1~~TRINITY_DN4791_c0_g1_i1.p1  ORF type:complete len:630 (+),score=217.98 TRINITY_DN4791_c0_g1_i1:33-1892(+)
MSDASSAPDLMGFLGSGNDSESEAPKSESEETVSVERNEFEDLEAEEAEDSSAPDDNDDDEEEEMPAPLPVEEEPVGGRCNQSYASETNDDGFLALAAEFAAFETPVLTAKSPSIRPQVASDPIDLTDPKLPNDPETIEAENKALEGLGAGQLKLEMRSLEITGMKLLKESPAAHDFLVWIRKLLKVHNAQHIKSCLLARVGNKLRGVYLFDRLRRRYWARLRGDANAAHAACQQLPLVTGAVKIEVPLEPNEAGYVGAVLPDAVASAIGQRAVGHLVSKGLISKAKGAEKVDASESLVILSACVKTIHSTHVGGGTYGSYTATVSAEIVAAPARNGGTVTGVVLSVTKPEYQLTRCISNPTKHGVANVAVTEEVTLEVLYGAEVPERSAAVGRVWVAQLEKNKDRVWRLHFAMDPFLTGAQGDQHDLCAKSGKEVSELNINRRPTNLLPSKNWAAVTDAKSGFRVIKELPEAGYWNPTSLEEILGTQLIRGYTVEVGNKRFKDTSGTRCSIKIEEDEVRGKVSYTITVQLTYDDVVHISTLFTPYVSAKKKIPKSIFSQIARIIEVLLLLRRAGAVPKDGSLAFREGDIKYDATGLRPEKPEKRKATSEKSGKKHKSE